MAPYILESDGLNGCFNDILPDFVISKDQSHMVFNKKIEKQDNDTRSYRIVRLANKLEALIIHDAKAEKAAASMDINVGYYSDKNIPGLAHYCAHLLFMFLNKHYVHYTTYTGSENTNYDFEVDHENLEPALERFAQIFISPSFNADCAEIEINAVDSEFKEYLQDDVWRLFQLQKFHSNPKHPFSKFSVGNLKTLKGLPTEKGVDIREELIKWHNKNYSANLMKLCVLGSNPLDKLTEWVVKKFSDIQNKNIESLKQVEIPLRKGVELCKQIIARPLNDIHILEVYIPIPNQIENYKAKAASYVSHVIGHRGAESICSFLKQRGWITSINVKTIEYSADFHMLNIRSDLTEDGLGNYENVLESIFQYIEMLRRKGPQKWIFEEVKSLNEISWRRFLEKKWEPSDTRSLARMLHKPYTRDRILSGPFKEYEYNPKLIIELLESLRIENCTISVASNDFDKKEWFDDEYKYQCETKSVKDKGKGWFGAEYRYEPINETLINKLKKLDVPCKFKLFPSNKFIPTNFTVNKLKSITPKTRPDIIWDDAKCRVWYKKDDRWWIPKVKIDLSFTTPLIKLTPVNLVKTELYFDLFNDSFADEAYDALLAGINYKTYVTGDIIFVNVSGYNDKALKFLGLVLKRMRNFVINPNRFNILKERLMESYNNMKLNPPLVLYDCQLFRDWYFSAEEMSAVLKDVRMEEVKSFCTELFGQFYMETFVFGNIESMYAKKIVYMVENEFKPKVLEKSRMVKSRDIILTKGKKFVYRRNILDKYELNNTVRYYLQCGDNMNRYVATRLQLISQIWQKPVFDYLSLDGQLECYPSSSIGEAGLLINLQSVRDPIYLENRIEACLMEAQKKKRICGMKPIYILIRFLVAIANLIKDAEEVKNITKDDVLEFYKMYIHPKSSQIKKLSLHLRTFKSANDNVNSYTLSEDNIIITDLDDFKSRMCFGPAVVPIVPLSTFYVQNMHNRT
ncbi:19914_t:CDS:10 [Funneliformis geosporum]|uniref:19914_t:CDS:1 n=1 Tax=Funneliformis geosporum TaxID=1117311 RepID=A0A9W4SB58_9GLOM|nr:19914_t:CDS:10 [Funneliformis geosporum]